jgi:hypothetical protein
MIKNKSKFKYIIQLEQGKWMGPSKPVFLIDDAARFKSVNTALQALKSANRFKIMPNSGILRVR